MPAWLNRLLLRARATASPDHARQLREELQLHVQLLEAEYTAQGMPAAEARRRAHLDFGNITRVQETSHELFSFRALADLVQDARYGLRQMKRNVSFTLVALFSLAIGIGAVTTAFAIADAFMLRGLPVHEPERLVAFSITDSPGWRMWPYALFARWRDSLDARVDVAAASEVQSVNVPEDHEPGTMRVSLVSSNYFQVMGVDMALGRPFTDAEDRASGASPVAVISDAFWKRRFGASGDLPGTGLNLKGVTYQVIGVTRERFTGHSVGHPSDVWIPLSMQPELMPDGGALLEDRWGTGRLWLTVVGRLHDDVSLEEAASSTNLISQRFVAEKAAAIGETNPQVVRHRKQVVSLLSATTGYAPERRRYALPLKVLTGVGALLLLVACANFTNLMLARAQTRRKEFAIRLALGGGRWRLIRQSTIECVMLALLAGTLGVLAASWATTASLKYFAEMIQPVELDLGLDTRVVGFAAACVALVIAFGLWPCTRPARSAALSSVPHAPKAAGGERRRTLGWRLVLIAQLAMCTALLIGAGLLLRTVTNLRSQDLGFDRNVLLVTISSERAGDNGRAATMLLDRVTERLLALPGIEAIGASGAGLLNNANYWVDGSQQLTTDRGAVVPGVQWTFAAVGPGFFGALGMPLVHGREFDQHDVNPPADVVVINRSLATLLFGSENPIGRRMGMSPKGANQLVIGVVNDAKQTSPRDRGLGVAYVPLRGSDRVVLAVRTTAPASEAVPFIRHQLASFESGLSIDGIRTIAEVLDEAIARERLMSVLSSILCALVMLVGCVGLYALLAYDVGQQTHELGIRLALGATRGRVVAMVLRDSAFLVAPGLAIGVPLGIAAIAPLASQLYGVRTADPLTLASVTLLLASVTLLAAWRPAHTASRIDPASLLRSE